MSLTLPHLSFPRELHIQLPYSKSVGARQLLSSYLQGRPLPSLGRVEEACLLYCEDFLVLHRALSDLRSRKGREVLRLQCGDSGTAFRFLTVTALYESSATELTGSPRLLERISRDDLSFIVQMGGTYQLGTDVLRINPPAKVKEVLVTSQWYSSQYLSAIELCNAYCGSKVSYHFESSRPSYSYLQLTKKMIAQGCGNEIERDWSAASFWYQLLATHPQIEHIYLPGLALDSAQPDATLPTHYTHLGIATTERTQGVVAEKKRPQRVTTPLTCDLTQNLDLFLTIALTALALKAPFRFTGIAMLRHKESDRIESFLHHVQLYGYRAFVLTDNSLTWDGTVHQPPAEVTIDPDRDHRVAMAMTMFALTQSPTTTILTPEVVAKSYPTFFTQLINIPNTQK